MISTAILDLLILCGSASAQLAQNISPPIVDLGYAKYEGVFNGTTNVTSFLGMRFAAAPIGELRWQAPQLPTDENENGIQKAVTQPLQCPQAAPGTADRNPYRVNTTSPSHGLMKRQAGGTTSTDIPISEDCLYLNVQYPGNTVPVKPLPVIAYIHGGGYLRGGADLYDGSFLIEQLNQGVILIVMQYRLGLFGFLAGDEVKKIGALNAGLLDQAFAFRWVREHISKFGGDPEQVTIWGKSAGADSVLQHVIAEDGETKPQLFRAAIASSPFLPTQYKYNDRNPRTLYNQVVEQTNLACLRKADTQALQAANMNVSMAGFYGTYMFVPVVDGKYVRQRPTEASKQGKVNGKGLYTVANAHEGDIYVNNATTPLSAGEYTSQLFPTLGSKEAAQVDRLYKDLGNPLQQENLIYGETIFICPAYFLLNAFKSTSFKAIPPAHHLDDIPVCFPTAVSIIPIGFNNPDFIKAFARSFVSFAISLDPGYKLNSSVITPLWDLYRPGNTEMVFNKTVDDSPDVHAVRTDGRLLDWCRFWESIGSITGQ